MHTYREIYFALSKFLLTSNRCFPFSCHEKSLFSITKLGGTDSLEIRICWVCLRALPGWWRNAKAKRKKLFFVHCTVGWVDFSRHISLSDTKDTFYITAMTFRKVSNKYLKVFWCGLMQEDACNNWLTLVYSTIQPPKDYCLSHRQAFCDWNKQVELQEALAPNFFIGSQIKLEPVFLWCRFLHISCIFLTLFEKRHTYFSVTLDLFPKRFKTRNALILKSMMAEYLWKWLMWKIPVKILYA